MKTRTFNTPEELMIALLQGEKWSVDKIGGVCFYKPNTLCPFQLLLDRMIDEKDSIPIDGFYRYCDGKTLWCKVEKKTELDLMKEKYASGEYVLVTPSNEWVIVQNPQWDCHNYRLIHKKHEEILEAYLAGNGGMIEIKCKDINAEWEWIDTDFIKNYDEAFEYRLKPQKKTISLAMFTCKYKNSKVWCNANVYETLESFIAYFSITKYSNHHEIPNTRYEIEVDDD